MGTTERSVARHGVRTRIARFGLAAIACTAVFAAAFALSACGGGTPAKTAGSTESTVSAGMAGSLAAQKVIVSTEALADKPAPWVLSSPESAVRSYLDWTSYAYRIATSSVASPTMGSDEDVRIDSYIQLNLEKLRLIDQNLQSISFGKSSTEGTHTLVPTKETWTYSYISSQTPGKVLGGPYSASYSVIYTVARTSQGTWAVYSVDASAIGKVQ